MRRGASIGDAVLRCGLIAVTDDGHIRWMAGEGAVLLATYWPAWSVSDQAVPRLVQAWMQREAGLPGTPPEPSPPETSLVISGPGRQLHVRMIHGHQGLFLWLEERNGSVRRTGLAETGLTSRERQVLEWIAHGKTNHEIGLILGISARTVQKHAERLYRKLGVETRLAAAMCLMERGSLFQPAC